MILLDKDTADAEWFNLKPSRQVLVYGDYWREELHEIEEFNWRGTNRVVELVGGIDFGSSPGHPFVYCLYAADCTDFKAEIEELEYEEDLVRQKITFYLLYEYRSGKDTLEAHADKIKESPLWHAGIPIFADPSAKQERIDLEETHGIVTLEANNAVESGINFLRAHLQPVRKDGKQAAHYYVVSGYFDCNEQDLVGTANEFNMYKYRRLKDGKVNRKDPEPINDHGLDVARYVVATSTAYFKKAFMPDFEEVEQGGYWFGGR